MLSDLTDTTEMNAEELKQKALESQRDLAGMLSSMVTDAEQLLRNGDSQQALAVLSYADHALSSLKQSVQLSVLRRVEDQYVEDDFVGDQQVIQQDDTKSSAGQYL